MLEVGIQSVINGDLRAYWIVISCFYGIIASIMKLWPGRAYLKLNQDGFEAAKSIWSKRFVRWEDSSNIKIFYSGAFTSVSYNFSVTGDDLVSKFQKKINLRNVGFLYKENSKEIFRLMIEYRNAALSR